tara:strand:- start:2135 stop:2599 length:465 start_codon:yes stop_codon:yes gene_type:complete
MNSLYLNIYNNLIKLTRNKILYNNDKHDTFYDRIIIFFFHLGFLLKEFKKTEDKENLQKFFDFCIRQIELSIREIGYGDATINKKMKDYVNLLFSIIDNIDSWELKNKEQKINIIKYYIDENSDFQNIVDYFEKYIVFLRKNTFNNLTKDILSH